MALFFSGHMARTQFESIVRDVTNNNLWSLKIANSDFHRHRAVFTHFLAALRANTSLRELHFYCDELCEKDTTAIFDAVPATVQHLDMSQNRVSSATIAKVLHRNTTLLSLTVDECGLNDADFEAIAAAVAHNRTLKELSVEFNDDITCYTPILRCVQTKNCTLECVRVDDEECNRKTNETLKRHREWLADRDIKREVHMWLCVANRMGVLRDMRRLIGEWVDTPMFPNKKKRRV